MEEEKIISRLRGSIVGGALGDALGYEVEFLDMDSIHRRFGEGGIRSCVVRLGEHGQRAALFSDDTQMTLYTAEALTRSDFASPLEAIEAAYVEWYGTQTGDFPAKTTFTLSRIPEMNERRAPGNTCLSAIRSICSGREAVNNSKGCGGVMRIAPIGLYAAATGRFDAMEAARLAGEAARLTHKHPLGYIPAAFTAYLIYRLTLDPEPTADSLREYAREGLKAMEQLYSYTSDFSDIIEDAIQREQTRLSDHALVSACGEGWVAEETVAIALVCALRHFDNVSEALIMAANHRGDSDSTAAVCGNILGAALGYEALDPDEVEKLELLPTLIAQADALA